jgi:hypothetical protein
MSTVQVSNIHFESTGNNRIQLEGSNVSVYQAGQLVLTASDSGITLSNGTSTGSFGPSTGNATSLPVGTIILTSSTPNSSFLECNNMYNKTTYSTLFAVTGNIDPGLMFLRSFSTGGFGIAPTNIIYTGSDFYMTGWTTNGFPDYIPFTTAFKSANAEIWTNASVTAPANNIAEMVYGNGSIVAITTGGLIMHSTNTGSAWATRTRANTNTLRSVGYGNGVFVIVGENGAIQTSTDAITWTNRTTANTQTMFGVTYGNGVYVAVGNSGAIQTSTDAITWTNRTSASANTLNYVCYGNNKFVAVGNSVIQTSTDAITWTLSEPISVSLTSVNVIANGYLAKGSSSYLFMTSPDGIYWNYIDINNQSVYDTIDFIYANNIFVGATYNGVIKTASSANSTHFYVPSHPSERSNSFFKSYIRAT